MVISFKSPKAFAWHLEEDLVVNGVNIFHKIEDAITQFDENNYEQFGEDIGDSLAMIVLGNEQNMTVTPIDVVHAMEDIVEGILWGAIKAEGYDDIKGCLSNSGKLY